MPKATIVKCDHHSRRVWSYNAEVLARGDTWVCVQARFAREDVNLGPIILRRGDLMTEWFYSDRWYNVFRIEDADDGRLKGWYCNITRPAALGDIEIAADDLALDVFVMPGGAIRLLDEAEFAALDLPADDRQAALTAVETIRALVSARTPPFDG